MSTNPLGGCSEKIKRANETIEQCDREINSFIDKYFKITVTKPDQHSGTYSVDATGKKPLDRFSVLVGEIVHHFRSSLDHLVWQLVIANKGTPNVFHEFPVCTNGKKYLRPKTQRKIKGVSDAARTLIQAAQPYNRTPCIDDPLLILHKLDITDKHRLLVVTDSRVSSPMMYVNRPPGDLVIEMTSTGGVLSSEASTPLARVRSIRLDPQMKVDTYPAFDIVFPKYGSVDNKPVIEALKHLSDFTENLINSFRGEFA